MLLRNEWDDDIVSSDDFWEMNDELTVMFFLWNECGKFAFDWYDFWKKLNEVILFLTGMIFEKLNEVILFLTGMIFEKLNEVIMFLTGMFFEKLNEVILFLTGMIFEKLNEVIMFLTGMIIEKLNEVIMFWYCWEKCSNQQC